MSMGDEDAAAARANETNEPHDQEDDTGHTKSATPSAATHQQQGGGEKEPPMRRQVPGGGAAAMAAVTSPPTAMDIICGRGKNITHPGNKRFHTLVMERKAAYQQAQRREEKTRITSEILKALKDPTTTTTEDASNDAGSATGKRRRSRFLIKDAATNNWMEVDEAYAREKISHSLRSKPSGQRGSKKRASCSSQEPRSSPPVPLSPRAPSATDQEAEKGPASPKRRCSVPRTDQTTTPTRRPNKKAPILSHELQGMVDQVLKEQQQLLQDLIDQDSSSSSAQQPSSESTQQR